MGCLMSTDLASCTRLLSLMHIEYIAHLIIRRLPNPLYKQIKGLVVHAENFATLSTLEQLKIGNRYDLLGLYRGIPVHEKGNYNKNNYPDTIFLYRAPLIRYSQGSGELIDRVIMSVLIHEIGHHLSLAPHEIMD